MKFGLLLFCLLFFISCQSEDERYLCNIVNQISACTYRSNTQNYNTYPNTQNYNNPQSYNTNTQNPDIYTCVENAQNQLLQKINDPNTQISQDQNNRVTRAMNTFSTCRNNSNNVSTGVNPNIYNPNTYNPNVNPNYNPNVNNPNINDPTNQIKRCTTTFSIQLRTALSC